MDSTARPRHLALVPESPIHSTAPAPEFYEFFAGGGMVRAGLGAGWRCLLANDIDPHKADAYRDNWGGEAFVLADIQALKPLDLPGTPDLVWGSFPCQDLSLAGARAGLNGQRSGTFYPFWDLVAGLAAQARAPRLVAVENVCGALTSHGGADFKAICRTFADAGYRFGPLVINADRFLPQSRPRLFIVGVRADVPISTALQSPHPLSPFHSEALQRAAAALPAGVARRLLWWNLPESRDRPLRLSDVVDTGSDAMRWHTADQTARLLALMSPVNLAKVSAAQAQGGRIVGCVFRRTRQEAGRRVQRAEVRFDDVAGCLRTPAGGSSRQAIVELEGGRVRSRLLSPRETARLMGLDDAYRLPRSSSQAFHLTGDGVAVPVVRHLAEHLLEPLLAEGLGDRRVA